jgi:hypothetical protein
MIAPLVGAAVLFISRIPVTGRKHIRVEWKYWRGFITLQDDPVCAE